MSYLDAVLNMPCPMSECVPSWIQKLIVGYEDDPITHQLLTELSISSEGKKHYTITKGVITYKGRLWGRK